MLLGSAFLVATLLGHTLVVLVGTLLVGSLLVGTLLVHTLVVLVGSLLVATLLVGTLVPDALARVNIAAAAAPETSGRLVARPGDDELGVLVGFLHKSLLLAAEAAAAAPEAG